MIVETRGSIKVVTLNRPKVGNALLFRDYHELAEVFTNAAIDNEIKAVVVTGTGPFFSVGAEGREMVSFSKKGNDFLVRQLLEGPVKLTQTIQKFPKLSVALVNGPAVGYPAGVLSSFDLVFCSPKAAWQPQFLHIGVTPEGGSSYIAGCVGWQKSIDFFLSNKMLNAQQMVDSGFASRILPHKNFKENGIKIVKEMLSQASFSAFLATKVIMKETFREKYDAVGREAKGLVAQVDRGDAQRMFAAKMQQVAMKKGRSKL